LLYLGNGLTYHNENWQVTHINPYNPMGHQNLKFLTIQDGGWPSSLKPLNNYISATGNKIWHGNANCTLRPIGHSNFEFSKPAFTKIKKLRYVSRGLTTHHKILNINTNRDSEI